MTDEDATRVRCPFCLCDVTTAERRSSREKTVCERCSRTFRVKDGLDAPAASVAAERADRPNSWAALSAKGRAHLTWRTYLGFLTSAVVLFSLVSRGWSGGAWILGYFVFAVLLVAAARTAERVLERPFWVLMAGIAAFELTGVFRYLDGVSRGLRNWGHLAEMMLLVWILFVVPVHRTGSSRGLGGVGGIGGGGGGGGGCGGCGG